MSMRRLPQTASFLLWADDDMGLTQKLKAFCFSSRLALADLGGVILSQNEGTYGIAAAAVHVEGPLHLWDLIRWSK